MPEDSSSVRRPNRFLLLSNSLGTGEKKAGESVAMSASPFLPTWPLAMQNSAVVRIGHPWTRIRIERVFSPLDQSLPQLSAPRRRSQTWNLDRPLQISGETRQRNPAKAP